MLLIALGKTNDPGAIRSIVSGAFNTTVPRIYSLENPWDNAYWEAFLALRPTLDESCIVPLLYAAQQNSYAVLFLIEYLKDHRTPKAADILLECIKNPAHYPHFRMLAIRCLAGFKDPQLVMGVLNQALQDPEFEVRTLAAKLLRRWKNKEPVKGSSKTSTDLMPISPGESTALVPFMADRPVQTWISTLKTSADHEERRTAACALRIIGDKMAVPILIRTLQYIPKDAQKSLFLDVYEFFLGRYDYRDLPAWNVRVAAADALGDLGDLRALDSLFVISDYANRGRPYLSLSNAAGWAITQLLRNVHERVIQGETLSHEEIKILARLAKTSDLYSEGRPHEVPTDRRLARREAAIAILAECRDVRAVEILANLLTDPYVGKQSEQALLRFGPSAIEPLRKKISFFRFARNPIIRRILVQLGDHTTAHEILKDQPTDFATLQAMVEYSMKYGKQKEISAWIRRSYAKRKNAHYASPGDAELMRLGDETVVDEVLRHDNDYPDPHLIAAMSNFALHVGRSDEIRPWLWDRYQQAERLYGKYGPDLPSHFRRGEAALAGLVRLGDEKAIRLVYEKEYWNPEMVDAVEDYALRFGKEQEACGWLRKIAVYPYRGASRHAMEALASLGDYDFVMTHGGYLSPSEVAKILNMPAVLRRKDIDYRPALKSIPAPARGLMELFSKMENLPIVDQDNETPLQTLIRCVRHTEMRQSFKNHLIKQPQQNLASLASALRSSNPTLREFAFEVMAEIPPDNWDVLSVRAFQEYRDFRQMIQNYDQILRSPNYRNLTQIFNRMKSTDQLLEVAKLLTSPQTVHRLGEIVRTTDQYILHPGDLVFRWLSEMGDESNAQALGDPIAAILHAIQEAKDAYEKDHSETAAKI